MTSRRSTAVEEITGRIMRLEYRPGQRLVERDLAADLGLSRVPVREALHRLEVDGLVISVPRQGTIVSTWSRTDITDLFEIRAALEPMAAEFAAHRRTDVQLRRLEETTRLKPESGVVEQTEYNAEFHRRLVEAANSPQLRDAMRPMYARMRWLFHLTRERGPLHQGTEHVRIAAAIRDGDADRARRLTAQHVLDGLRPTLAALADWGEERADPVAATKSRRR
ncbi:GntR family transcriptional regulator [Haloglycomyces albus]|uniref:GntR family transcriptional regulator n=1 Tax=Haloglycomyces albus TaxID=526067 RepID=UPI0004A3E855|nr:GntR family transcriptional regulator [Haloglycomyces albus]